LDPSFNCEEIAASFGGGGHKMAAGCLLSKSLYSSNFKIVKKVKLTA